MRVTGNNPIGLCCEGAGKHMIIIGIGRRTTRRMRAGVTRLASFV